MTVPKTFDIQQASNSILKELLPKSWLLQEQNPDYSHIDFLIQVVKNTELTGIYFAVQLKGTEKLKVKNEYVKFSLPSKHLKYYMEKVQNFPVFLVIVDVINKNAYWLFMQKYLKGEIINKHWENQKNVTIDIPLKNTIDNISAFEESINKAVDYMKELWPSSFTASAKKEEEYFKNIDPRFGLRIIYDKGTIFRNFYPKEPIKMEVVIKSEKANKEFQSISLDKKMIFSKDEIEFVGSDLFKVLSEETENIKFDVKIPTYEVDLYLFVDGYTDNYSEFIHFKGNLLTWLGNMKIECQTNSSPFKIKCISDDVLHRKLQFNFEMDWNTWLNKPIHSLPTLSEYYSIFEKLKDGKKPVINFVYLDKDYSFKMNSSISNDFFKIAYENLLLYKKLKTIDTFFRLNYLFPDLVRLKKYDFYNINKLYDLAIQKEHIVEDKEININITALFIKNSNFLNEYSRGIEVNLVKDDGQYEFLGENINIGKYEINICNPKLLINHKQLIKLFESNNKDIPLKFTTDENSKVIYRLLE